MCGIAGYVRMAGKETSAATILGMVRAQKHRGPDDEGIALIDAQSGRTADAGDFEHDLALGHCRFSIIDLSAAGHQPFWSAERRICVVFNGEIYNYVELKDELERLGHSFRSHSDTEVLVEAYRQWGTECFRRFIGFWAIALYDAAEKRLLLARDRLGKAPLYFARKANALWFASEVNAIRQAAGSSAFVVREQAIADYMAHSWRDVDHKTFFDGIETFPNAAYAWVNPDGTFQPLSYWELPQHRLSEREIPVADAVGEFRSRLADAVRLRLRADVPIGFELSGGLDSSTLVAAATMQNRRIHAYNVSFPGTPADEELYARQVAQRHSGLVEYTVLNPPRDDFWEQADEYVHTMGEPFHAPNMIANRDIWRDMSGRGIRVSINGAAGDEAWGGYFNDYYAPFLRKLLRTGRWRQLLRNCRLFGEMPHSIFSKTVWRRLMAAASGARSPASDDVYLTSSPGSRLCPLPESDNPLRVNFRPQFGPRPDIERLMIDHMGPWRMNHWLRVANQSYMSVPTEVRCPFLDHRLVELAFTLPITYLIRDGWLKWLVRQAMNEHLPPDVAWRKRKMGFPFPYEQWAAGSKGRFFAAIGGLDLPYVDFARLREAWDRLAGGNPLFLWRVMCLCLWWKRCVLGERLG